MLTLESGAQGKSHFSLNTTNRPSHGSLVFKQALFRLAVGLLKVQQSALLQLSCPLEIMQYMKRAARVTYDKDHLFKVSLNP